MVVLSECYFQGLDEKSITLCFVLDVSPKTYKNYVDDSHVKFENKQKPLLFLEILNKQDPFSLSIIEFKN